MITSFLLGFGSTLGLPFPFAFEQGTSFPLLFPLSPAPFPVARPLSNGSMCFRHNHSTSGPGRMVAHEHLILLFGNR
jgi:hypothetical protein